MIPRSVGRFFRTLFCSALLSPLPFSYAPTAVHATQMPIIGEVMWAGSSLSSADEWLELWNDSDEPLALAGYVLRGTSPSDIVFDETQTILAHGTFLIANYAYDDIKSVIATSVQLVTTAVSLSNSQLKIELFSPDGTLVDTAGDGTTPPAGSSLPTKTSMIRAIDGSWISATSSMNLDNGITDFATPGFCDACGTPVTPAPTVDPEPEPVAETTTTTEPIIETPTSTEPVLEPLVGTSSTTETITSTSTETAPIEPIVETTSTIELPIQAAAPIEPVVTAAPTLQESVPTPLLLSLRLRTIFPAPSSGQEYIDIDVEAGTNPLQALGWSIKDGTSIIFRFQESTLAGITIDRMIWRITFASAHLNNGGDSVELIRPDGSVAERMTYPTTDRDKSWIKNVDGNAWIIDPPNRIVSTPAPTVSPIATPTPGYPPTIELPIIETTLTEPIETVPIAKPETKIKATSPKPTASAKPKTTTTVKKTPVKKVTTTKVDPAPPLVTIDMLTQLEPEIRVTLEGTVGTLPGILSKNQFTLHTPDGRGLLVRGTSKQTSPEFGSHIRLTGTLSLNDDGLSLKMLSKDKWVHVDGNESIQPRIVDLLAPSQEDAWSLIQVTGTVIDTASGRASLELGGIPITVKIRPVTGYRAERLSKGDTVRMTGIVDTRGEEPLLYPRQTSEIEIITHAKLAPAGPMKTTWPAWTPFGAAGITIAVTEGYKRLRRLTKERKLKKLAALAQ
ncbi:lamin tail domain-containing protein [Candidatus Uhrbacteria bacterium]|nr:lamin tail domain-containing protein [Candidatus Uhrbacteria bacterium]